MLIVWLICLIAPDHNLLVLLLFGLAFTFCSILAGIYFVIVIDKARLDRVQFGYTRRLERELGIDRDD
ncbi:hypothetical protein A5N83_13845 [Rhodococcus sp. 1139]|nr:hypothetical protein A5N83_13845 [Rhodococcus sp. 1139]